MSFRQVGQCLDSETASRLTEIGERYFGAQASTAERLELESFADGRKEAADGEPPASWRAGGVARMGLMVISTGRAARTATHGQPRPAARPALITVDGQRRHAASASAAGSGFRMT